MLYKTMILPVLEYGDVVLDGALSETLVSEIQTIQNNCLRACLTIWDPRSISRLDLHVRCTSKPLKLRRTESLLCRMFKLSQDEDNVVVPTRVLRSNDKVILKVQRPKGGLYRRSPKYRGFLAWSKLDADVQKIGTYTKFVTKIKG